MFMGCAASLIISCKYSKLQLGDVRQMDKTRDHPLLKLVGKEASDQPLSLKKYQKSTQQASKC